MKPVVAGVVFLFVGLIIGLVAKGTKAARFYDARAREHFGMSFRQLRDECGLSTEAAQQLLRSPGETRMLKENWAHFGRPILSYPPPAGATEQAGNTGANDPAAHR